MQNYNAKSKIKKNLERAVAFHGHLGPYLVLGLKMGDLAIRRLKCKKYFGIASEVKGTLHKPKSCLIDGIQISTGCTYGKGNIKKKNGKIIEVLFKNLQNNKKLSIFLRKDIIRRLGYLKKDKESEAFARELLKTNSVNLFEVK